MPLTECAAGWFTCSEAVGSGQKAVWTDHGSVVTYPCPCTLLGTGSNLQSTSVLALVVHLQESHMHVGATTVAAAKTAATTGERTDQYQLESSLWFVILLFRVFSCCVHKEVC